VPSRSDLGRDDKMGRTDSVVLSQLAVPLDKSDGSMATDPAPARNAGPRSGCQRGRRCRTTGREIGRYGR